MKKTGFAALAVSLVLLFAVAAAVYGRLSGRYAPPPRACPSRGEKHGGTARSCHVPARNAGARHDRTARADLRYFRRRHRRSAARSAGNNRGSSAGNNAEKYNSAGKNHSGENLSGNSSAGNDPAAGNGSADNGSAGTVAPETEDPNKNTAPDFPVLDADGNTVRLSDMFGKPVVINFWATWCPPCKRELPDFDRLCREYGDRVVFMMVNLTDGRRDTVDGTKKFVSEKGYTFPVYFDTGLSGAKAYSVSSTPQTTFIDANGNVFATRIGAMSEAALRSYINAILGG